MCVCVRSDVQYLKTNYTIQKQRETEYRKHKRKRVDNNVEKKQPPLMTTIGPPQSLSRVLGDIEYFLAKSVCIYLCAILYLSQ